jgi:hypothetical protein
MHKDHEIPGILQILNIDERQENDISLISMILPNSTSCKHAENREVRSMFAANAASLSLLENVLPLLD